MRRVQVEAVERKEWRGPTAAKKVSKKSKYIKHNFILQKHTA
jgi:hypothetical protein